MNRIAIVGAGMAGLAAAWSLRRSGREVVVFEKSRGLSGRAATRRRNGHRYDHGANFFRTDDAEVAELVHEILPTEDLVEIPGEVWTFDAAGRVERGDPEVNGRAKYTYRQGISMLGKLLVAASEPELHRQTRVARMRAAGGKWILLDEIGTDLGGFDAVVVTAPAPQSAELLAASTFGGPLRVQVCEALARTEYDQQFTFVLGHEREWERNRMIHALVNKGGGHEVSWMSFENDKAGHVPAGGAVLIVQMAADWSAASYEVPRADLLPLVVSAARSILPEVPDPSWWDSQRWRFARPRGAVDGSVLRAAEQEGLYFAGDWLAGRGRIPVALKSGLEVARQLVQAVP